MRSTDKDLLTFQRVLAPLKHLCSESQLRQAEERATNELENRFVQVKVDGNLKSQVKGKAKVTDKFTVSADFQLRGLKLPGSDEKHTARATVRISGVPGSGFTKKEAEQDAKEIARKYFGNQLRDSESKLRKQFLDKIILEPNPEPVVAEQLKERFRIWLSTQLRDAKSLIYKAWFSSATIESAKGNTLSKAKEAVEEQARVYERQKEEFFEEAVEDLLQGHLEQHDHEDIN